MSPNKKEINIFWLIIFIVALIVFISLDVQVTQLLNGHTYGSPDKYGDYARGLYASECEIIERNLWLMLPMIGVQLFSFFKSNIIDKWGKTIYVPLLCIGAFFLELFSYWAYN